MLSFSELTPEEKSLYDGSRSSLKKIEQARVRAWVSKRRKDGTLPKILLDIQKSDEEERLRCETEERRVRDARARQCMLPVVTALPVVNLNTSGVVGFRQWVASTGGRLKSESHGYYWKTMNFADVVPQEGNSSGFYAMDLRAVSVMQGMRGYFDQTHVFGFVDLYGRVQRHSDGTLRSEMAKVLYAFVTPQCQILPAVFLPDFAENFPAVPIYVLNVDKIAELVFWEAAKKMLRDR